MIKNTLRQLSILICTIFLNLVFITPAFADVSNDVGYNVQAIIPNNQLDKSQSYFDIRVTPGEHEKIEVMINNTSDEKSTFSVSLNQAYTNSQGFIDYIDSDITPDDSLVYNISDIAVYEEEVTVEANSSILFPIELKIPSDEFSGVIMAGIHIVKGIENNTDESGIQNNVGYVIGLNITQNDEEVARELLLKNIRPELSFGRTSVVASIQNPTMDAIGKLIYKATISDVKTKKTVITKEYDKNMQIAPNSTYDFIIDMDNQNLIAGNYSLNLEISDAKGNEWKFNDEFEITKKEANHINSLAISDTEPRTNNFIWYVIISVIFAILLLMYLIYNYKIKHKSNNKKHK